MLYEQGIPCTGSIPSVTYTGEEKNLFEESDENLRSTEDGVVDSINDEFITVRTNDNRQLLYKRPKNKNTMNHSSSFFDLKVKVGSKVKAGDVLVNNTAFQDGELSLGVPLLTAFTSYYGLDYTSPYR